MSKPEEELAFQMRLEGLIPEREYRFGAEACGGTGKGLRVRLEAAGLRDWRFDFCFPLVMLAIEVEGDHGQVAAIRAALALLKTCASMTPPCASAGLSTAAILQW